MRVGFDGSCLSNRRGFGRFARQTLQALASSRAGHELVVLVDRPSLDRVFVPDGVRGRCGRRGRGPEPRGVEHRAPADQRHARDGPGGFPGAGFDLMYFPATYSFFPVWNVGRVVVTMHDTLALAHPELVFPTWKGRLAWALKEHAAVRWADRIVTVSEAARRDLIAWFRLPGDRVRVVSEGPDAGLRPSPTGAESDAVARALRARPRRSVTCSTWAD